MASYRSCLRHRLQVIVLDKGIFFFFFLYKINNYSQWFITVEEKKKKGGISPFLYVVIYSKITWRFVTFNIATTKCQTINKKNYGRKIKLARFNDVAMWVLYVIIIRNTVGPLCRFSTLQDVFWLPPRSLLFPRNASVTWPHLTC